ncbi:MAG: cyclic nucleotide-binding domain-containing protein [Candidatus Nanopelagicales bacterium]
MTESSKFGFIEHATDPVSYANGQTIFQEGDLGQHLYFVKSGEVAISVHDTVIDRIGPGDIFGEMALIDHKVRSATATAVSDTEVVPVDERRFLFLVQQHPYFAINLMSVLADRIRRRSES